MDDISNELELADEDDKIPYATSYLLNIYARYTEGIQLQNRRLLHLVTTF